MLGESTLFSERSIRVSHVAIVEVVQARRRKPQQVASGTSPRAPPLFALACCFGCAFYFGIGYAPGWEYPNPGSSLLTTSCGSSLMPAMRPASRLPPWQHRPCEPVVGRRRACQAHWRDSTQRRLLLALARGVGRHHYLLAPPLVHEGTR